MMRSVGVVFAGILVNFVLSLGTDVVMHKTGVFPGWGQAMATTLFAVALAYRLIYTVIGGYVTAALAPRDPMKHAVILGVIGIVLATAGAAATWNKGPEFGPKWYPLALIVTALPVTWLGARLQAANADAQSAAAR
jgi:hypothetical protein